MQTGTGDTEGPRAAAVLPRGGERVRPERPVAARPRDARAGPAAAGAARPGLRLFYERARPARARRGRPALRRRGNEYLDAYNNVASRRALPIRAWSKRCTASATLNTHTRYLHAGIVDYAEDLLATLPRDDRARHVHLHGPRQTISRCASPSSTPATASWSPTNAYHGNTELAAASRRRSVPSSPSGLRGSPSRRPTPTACARGDARRRLRRQVAAAIEDLAARGYGLRRVHRRLIFASDGVFAEPDGIPAAVVEVVHRGRRPHTSPTRCSRGSAAPATDVGLQRHGSRPTSSPSASRWATASGRRGHVDPRSSSRSAATPLLQHLRRQRGRDAPRRRPCWT